MYDFFVPGIARTAGSHMTYKGRVVHASKYTKVWMDTVGWYFMQTYGRPCLLKGAVEIGLVFFIERPKSHYGSGRNSAKLKPSAPMYPTKRPDLDKLCRAVQDALTGLCWQDDSVIVKIKALKFYSEDKPGVRIQIAGL